MANNVNLECFCGAVKGNLRVVSNKKSFHIHCLCCDCQSFASYLENEDKILDEYGGSEIFQTHPSYIKITEGKEKLSCVRLTEKGLMRWYTSCCKAPVANTMSSPKMPFAGVSVKFMKFSSEEEKKKVLGPVIMKAFGKYAKGKMPEGAHESFPKTFIFNVARFMIRGFLGGRHTPSPFFHNGSPTVTPKILGS